MRSSVCGDDVILVAEVGKFSKMFCEWTIFLSRAGAAPRINFSTDGIFDILSIVTHSIFRAVPLSLPVCFSA